jgi:hypothetical protein
MQGQAAQTVALQEMEKNEALHEKLHQLQERNAEQAKKLGQQAKELEEQSKQREQQSSQDQTILDLNQQLEQQEKELTAIGLPSTIRSLQTSRGMHKKNSEKSAQALEASKLELAHESKMREQSERRCGTMRRRNTTLTAEAKETKERAQRQEAQVDAALTECDNAKDKLGVFETSLQGFIVKVECYSEKSVVHSHCYRYDTASRTIDTSGYQQ